MLLPYYINSGVFPDLACGQARSVFGLSGVVRNSVKAQSRKTGPPPSKTVVISLDGPPAGIWTTGACSGLLPGARITPISPCGLAVILPCLSVFLACFRLTAGLNGAAGAAFRSKRKRNRPSGKMPACSERSGYELPATGAGLGRTQWGAPSGPAHGRARDSAGSGVTGCRPSGGRNHDY
jgi:hypothetical protein